MDKIGAITDYIDVAQLVLYAFWIFFAGLIIYLRMEDKREGYPLESTHKPGEKYGIFFPPYRGPKSFRLEHGEQRDYSSARRDTRDIATAPVAPWEGAPFAPTGDPLADGVGPASYAERANEPDLTGEGEPKIVPTRVASDFTVVSRDPDPRGMPVLGADGALAGTVRDLWVDRVDLMIRYLEVEPAGDAGHAAAQADQTAQAGSAAAEASHGSAGASAESDSGQSETAPEAGASSEEVEQPAAAASGPAQPHGQTFLVPVPFIKIDKRRGRVHIKALLGEQMHNVPRTADPDSVTRREEDRISGYFGGGRLYATPNRQEPII